MYALLRDRLARLLKAPTDPPEPPAGDHESVEVFRASPKYLKYRLLAFWISLPFVLLIAGVVIFGTVMSEDAHGIFVVVEILAFGGLLCGKVANYFSIRIEYDLRYYILTDRSLRIREGIWQVREKTLTYANIQNLKVTQGPLQRFFGISDLQIQTAGGGGMAQQQQGQGMTAHQAAIRGVENAQEIRDRIREYMRTRGGGAGLGDEDDRDRPTAPAAERPVAAAGAWSPEALAALRDVRDAARRLRDAAA